MIAEPPTQDIQEVLEDVFSFEHRFLFYVFGPPAAGKTTVLDEACRQANLDTLDPPKRYWHELYCPGRGKVGVYLGKQRAEFGGTDALPMNAITGVLAGIAEELPPLVIGEGDRLANDRFFKTLADLEYDLCLYHLSANPHILRKRDLARGSEQDPTWRQGRITKTVRLAKRWPAMYLNATMPVHMNAGIIASAIADRLPMVEGRRA